MSKLSNNVLEFYNPRSVHLRYFSLSFLDSVNRKFGAVSRCEAIQLVAKPTPNRRPLFAVMFDPRLPNMQLIVNKQWWSMENMDSYTCHECDHCKCVSQTFVVTKVIK